MGTKRPENPCHSLAVVVRCWRHRQCGNEEVSAMRKAPVGGARGGSDSGVLLEVPVTAAMEVLVQ